MKFLDKFFSSLPWARSLEKWSEIDQRAQRRFEEAYERKDPDGVARAIMASEVAGMEFFGRSELPNYDGPILLLWNVRRVKEPKRFFLIFRSCLQSISRRITHENNK